MDKTFYLVGARGSLKHEVIDRFNEIHKNNKLDVELIPVDPVWLTKLPCNSDDTLKNNSTKEMPNSNNNIMYLYTTAYDQEKILTNRNGCNFAESLKITNEDLYLLRWLPKNIYTVDYKPNDDFIDRVVDKIYQRIAECINHTECVDTSND